MLKDSWSAFKSGTDIRGVAVEGAGFAAFGLAVRVEFLADRVAAEDYFLCREKAFHAVVRYADALHLLCKHPVGESGK